MHLSGLSDKYSNSDRDDADSNHLICCYFKLDNNSLLKAVCLIDMVFYLVALTFNLPWTVMEMLGISSVLGADHLLLHIGYTCIMVGNLLLLIFSIHFKMKYRKYNMMLRNCYFETYHLSRIIWAIFSSLTAAGILYYMYRLDDSVQQKQGFSKFKKISNMFCIVYFVYALFCLSSSIGFKRSWYGLTNKDINFYFS